jgi:mercuric ion binding protein
MKRLVLLFTIVALSTGVTFAQKQQKKDDKKETVEFFVTSEEMCHNCVRKVNNNLPFEKGVTGLDVSQEKNTIRITYRKDRTSPEKLKAAIEKLNMKVEKVKQPEGKK